VYLIGYFVSYTKHCEVLDFRL